MASFITFPLYLCVCSTGMLGDETSNGWSKVILVTYLVKNERLLPTPDITPNLIKLDIRAGPAIPSLTDGSVPMSFFPMVLSRCSTIAVLVAFSQFKIGVESEAKLRFKNIAECLVADAHSAFFQNYPQIVVTYVRVPSGVSRNPNLGKPIFLN